MYHIESILRETQIIKDQRHPVHHSHMAWCPDQWLPLYSRLCSLSVRGHPLCNQSSQKYSNHHHQSQQLVNAFVISVMKTLGRDTAMCRSKTLCKMYLDITGVPTEDQRKSTVILRNLNVSTIVPIFSKLSIQVLYPLTSVLQAFIFFW